MNKRKLLLVALSLCMVAILAMGGTLAYLTDTDSQLNVMTLGKVDISQNEQQQGENGLEDFAQDKPLLPMVAVANIWLFIYTPMYGLLGYINPNWRFLTDPSTVLWALIVMMIWKQAGYVMVFFISGLQNINPELYEAAHIDGANNRQIFWKITWPMLMPTTLYVMIITMTNAFKLVDHLYIMTKGGPGNSSNMLLFYVYQTAFDRSNTGYASAITVVIIVLLLVLTAVQFFTQDKRTYYS